mmetsp:Transcript_81544/g.127263  ORF Transcript_81544/g.127263 Transcript_81544/m.127263 type:complete len:109 (-) Transcript_81544:10-336(-)
MISPTTSCPNSRGNQRRANIRRDRAREDCDKECVSADSAGDKEDREVIVHLFASLALASSLIGSHGRRTFSKSHSLILEENQWHQRELLIVVGDVEIQNGSRVPHKWS